MLNTRYTSKGFADSPSVKPYFFLCAITFATAASPVHSLAQENLDTRLLYSIYSSDSQVMQSTMQIAERASWPVFIGAPVAYWTAALADDSRSASRRAYRQSLSQGGSLALVALLKHTIKRKRPYDAIQGIDDKTRASDRKLAVNSYSFPSGHAAMAFSIASYTVLEHPSWYVILPATLVASGISLSRVWSGVHYPSDIVAGAVIGTGMSILVYVLRDTITPSGLKDNQVSSDVSAPTINLRFTF